MPLPFGLKLKRTRRYTVSSKSCLVARIQLLNNEFVEFTLSVESTGQESLEAVAQRLELREVSRKQGRRLVALLLSHCHLRWPCVGKAWPWPRYLSSACKPTAP